MARYALGLMIVMALGGVPAFGSAEQSFPLVVNQAVHHDTAPPRGSDLLGPTSVETPGRKEKPLHYPHPEQVDKPISDTPVAPEANFSLSGTPFGWDGLSVGEAGGGSWIPPDPNGAVGTSEYVQWVNAAFAIFDKSTGARKTDPASPTTNAWPGNALWKGFGGGCETNNDGDPIVQFDKLSNRWVMTQFSVSTKPYLQCIAVSSSDSFYDSFFHLNGQTFYRYAFAYDFFNDYPKLGVWPDAYYITFNMFKGNFVGPWACAYDRSSMLKGEPATQVCFKISSVYSSLMPATFDGTNLPPALTPQYAYLLSLGSGNCAASNGETHGCLNFWKFHVDFTTPTNSTLTVTPLYVNGFNRACGGGACIQQPNTKQSLDSLGDRLMYRLAYRNFRDHEALIVNHSVNANGVTGLRWYELRNAAGSTMATATPIVYQQGTFAPDSLYRWMGSIAMDKDGNIAIGYSVSSSSEYPGIRLTGRGAKDPHGSLSGDLVLIAGSGSQTKENRWGDYTALTIDPVDDCTMYYTNEYLPNNGNWNWNTRIYRFKFKSCQ
ncbi:MAG: hypothetical protein OEW32_07675 [Nitrospira sp.]|nr:hypothetical protein [Nitrospira sp.]